MSRTAQGAQPAAAASGAAPTLPEAAARLRATAVGRVVRALQAAEGGCASDAPAAKRQRREGARDGGAAECWGFCAAPPLEQYTGWPPQQGPAVGGVGAATLPARPHKQAITEGLCEGMVVEGEVAAVAAAALVVRLRRVRPLSPGGCFVPPPPHLADLWPLQLHATCAVSEIADEPPRPPGARANGPDTAHQQKILGRFVPGDSVRAVILHVDKAAEASVAATTTGAPPPPPIQLSFRSQCIR